MRVCRLCVPLKANIAGNVLTITAFCLPLVIGAVGFAVDVAGWQQTKRMLQGAADSAAFSAATASAAGATSTRASEEAKAVLSTYGIVDGSNGATVIRQSRAEQLVRLPERWNQHHCRSL